MVLPYSSTDYGEDQGGAINIQELIVPSSTAFDPTEDESTGTMKAIRDYIGTLIDIEPQPLRVVSLRARNFQTAQLQALRRLELTLMARRRVIGVVGRLQ